MRLQVGSEMFKVFQADGEAKQQGGDGTVPLSPPLNEALLDSHPADLVKVYRENDQQR